MNPSGAGRMDGARAPGGGRRRAWILVFAVTAVCAGAAFLAASLMPPVYRAAIELKGTPGFATRSLTIPQSEIARAAGLPDRPMADGKPHLPPPIRRALDGAGLAGWPIGAASSGAGLEPKLGGRIVVWADAADPATAGAQADAIAAHVSGLAPRPIVVPPIPMLQAAAPAEAGLASLRREFAAASERAAEAGARRDDAASANAASALPDDASIEARLRSATMRRADLRRQLAALDRTRGAIRAGDVAAGEAEVGSIPGWTDLQRLTRQKRELEASVADLSRTLLEGHPRMVMARLRLQDLQGELAGTSRRIEGDLQRREAELNGEMRRADAEIEALETRRAALAQGASKHADLVRAAEIENGVQEKLRLALASAETAQTRPATEAAPAPAADPVERTVLPLVTRAPPVWPATAVAAVLGFVVSAGGVAMAGGFRSKVLASPARREAPGPRKERSMPQALEVSGFEVAAIDDVTEAIVASGISRAILASPGGTQQRPLGVDIVRRLAARGHASVLVDLSRDQAAARAMGAAPDSPGLADLIEGDATFASIARRDFATKADIVSGGRAPSGSKLDADTERRNVLDFIERSYETLLVDCRDMTPEAVGSLMDADAALLLAVPDCTSSQIETAVAAFRRAGLGDMILVGESRSLP